MRTRRQKKPRSLWQVWVGKDRLEQRFFDRRLSSKQVKHILIRDGMSKKIEITREL